MVSAGLQVDQQGCLVSCEVTGHSGAAVQGQDVVCAAVSVLVRTALLSLSSREGIRVVAQAPGPGTLGMSVEYDPSGMAFLQAISVFLREGLESVASEWPEHCKVCVQTEWRQ